MTAESHTFTPRSFVKANSCQTQAKLDGLYPTKKARLKSTTPEKATHEQVCKYFCLARDPVCSPSRFPVGCSQLAALLCRVWAGQRSRTHSKAALQQAYQLGRGWQRSKSALISSEGRR